MNCISATGRMPIRAAPMAAPTMADSEIGVSITRIGPKRSSIPFGNLEGAAVDADILAEDEDAVVLLHFFPDAIPDGVEVGSHWHAMLLGYLPS